MSGYNLGNENYETYELRHKKGAQLRESGYVLEIESILFREGGEWLQIGSEESVEWLLVGKRKRKWRVVKNREAKKEHVF